MKLSFLIFFTCFMAICTSKISAQQIQVLTSGNKISIRGLSVVNDNIIWVSGSKGSVAKSIDAGKTWEWMTVKNFEQGDFRDIEAFDANTAIIMAISEPANILKTTDGGKSWKIVFTDSTKGMFLDAMDFGDDGSGIAVGDPIDGKFYIIQTADRGNSWQKNPSDKLPIADSGEGCFASSGTNIRKTVSGQTCFISGGPSSHLFIGDKKIVLPVIQGKESTGANSVAVWNDEKIKKDLDLIVVGGDFNKDTSREKNSCLTHDGGETWIIPTTPPHGYRSCVEYITENQLVTCGLSGVDVSTDGGMNWKLISNESFHVCRKAKKGKSVFLAGSNGKIAKLGW